ncbi:MAG: DUF4293 domain-containing protein [Bacteroidota bacterium]
MLQRIQTVYLSFVFVFTLMFLFFPLGSIHLANEIILIKTWGLSTQANEIEYNSLPGYLALALSFFIMILTVFTIFKYKKRLLQIKLGKINIFLHVLMVVSYFFFLDNVKKGYEDSFSYGIAVVFPLLSMILILMANRSVKKDEELVRSADRIR